MARLLVRTVDGENALRYMRGDVVGVFPEDHVFGAMENAANGFAVVSLEGLSEADARAYLEPGDACRRRHAVTLDALERRAVGTGRDTLRTQGQITRRWADVQSAFTVKN